MKPLRNSNGLRQPLKDDTTGCYIWVGEELSDDPNFFNPLHVKHLDQWCPEAIPSLALPPGWRFLFAPEYEDVWKDATLLDVDLIKNGNKENEIHAKGRFVDLRTI